jgi:hypothetical protein
MIYSLLLIEHKVRCEESGTTIPFNPQINTDAFDAVVPLLEENMKKISIMVQVNTYSTSDPMITDIIKNRYCKIILKHNAGDRKAFKLYSENIPDDKCFHFLANPQYEKQTELKEIFSIVTIGTTLYTISFRQLEVPVYFDTGTDMSLRLDSMDELN